MCVHIYVYGDWMPTAMIYSTMCDIYTVYLKNRHLWWTNQMTNTVLVPSGNLHFLKLEIESDMYNKYKRANSMFSLISQRCTAPHYLKQSFPTLLLVVCLHVMCNDISSLYRNAVSSESCKYTVVVTTSSGVKSNIFQKIDFLYWFC